MSEFVVYTDGASCKDGRGGWGYSIRFDDCWWDECGGTYDTTNNRMELQAVISALHMIDQLADAGERMTIQVWADSQYVLKGITEYIDDWKFRNWRTSGNQPVKNRDLWEALDAVSQKHTIDWQWVKGHTGNVGNERADRLAAKGTPGKREVPAVQAHRSSVFVRRRAAQ